MKKNIIVGIILFIGIILIAVLVAILLTNNDISNQSSDISNEVYSMYPDDVDGAVQYFMNRKEYKNINKDKQAQEIGDLLKLYQKNSIIKNLYYDEATPMYTFIYNTGDIKGALGGVSLKTWDPMMN